MTPADHPQTERVGQTELQAAAPAAAIDPVCGMRVDPARTPHHLEHQGRAIYFCSAGCVERFRKDPEHYLAAAARGQFAGMTAPAAIPPGAAVEYFCPMDPEVRSDRPGACPKCGMALEPRLSALSGEEPPDPELASMQRRLLAGALLTLPLFALAMGPMLPELAQRSSRSRPIARAWAQLLLATPVVLWAGRRSSPAAVASLRNRSLNMFTLIALGVGVAYVYSVVATLAPGLFPDGRGSHGGRAGRLLRGGGRDHGARPPGPGARAPRPRQTTRARSARSWSSPRDRPT